MTSTETIEAAADQCTLVSEIACAAMPRECRAELYIALLAFSNDLLVLREWMEAVDCSLPRATARRPSARRGRK
jgi:hypothetical protein